MLGVNEAFRKSNKIRVWNRANGSKMVGARDGVRTADASLFSPSSSRTYNYLQVCGRLPSTCKFAQAGAILGWDLRGTDIIGNQVIHVVVGEIPHELAL